MSATETKTETFKVGIYNGKKFKVLFAGNTKHGERAKLCWFSDEDKSFWVDLTKVEIVENTPPKAQAHKKPAKTTKHCATCACGAHQERDEGSEEQPEPDLFGHPAPVSKPVGHKVGKGSTTCGCGNKKKPQFAVCYDCFQTEKEDMGDYS